MDSNQNSTVLLLGNLCRGGSTGQGVDYRSHARYMCTHVVLCLEVVVKLNFSLSVGPGLSSCRLLVLVLGHCASMAVAARGFVPDSV